MAVRRTYVRPMDGWWRRDPFFMKYMAREVTAFFVVAYAFILLVGLIRLSQGPAAFEGWLAALASPGSILFHVLLFLVFCYHTLSWFQIMPKTMPPVVVGGKRLAPGTITSLGVTAAIVVSAAMLGLFIALAP